MFPTVRFNVIWWTYVTHNRIMIIYRTFSQRWKKTKEYWVSKYLIDFCLATMVKSGLNHLLQHLMYQERWISKITESFVHNTLSCTFGICFKVCFKMCFIRDLVMNRSVSNFIPPAKSYILKRYFRLFPYIKRVSLNNVVLPYSEPDLLMTFYLGV